VHVAAGRSQWLAASRHLEAASRNGGAPELADARTAIAIARDDPQGILTAAEDVVSDLGLLSLWVPTMPSPHATLRILAEEATKPTASPNADVAVGRRGEGPSVRWFLLRVQCGRWVL